MGITDRLKTVFIADEEFEDIEDEEFNENSNVEQPHVEQKNTSNDSKTTQNTSSQEDVSSEFLGSNDQSEGKVVLIAPANFTDSRDIAEFIKTNTSVCINLNNLEVEEARRVIDFVSGVIFALDGKMSRVSNGVFLCTPRSIIVEGNIPSTNSSNSENVKKW